MKIELWIILLAATTCRTLAGWGQDKLPVTRPANQARSPRRRSRTDQTQIAVR